MVHFFAADANALFFRLILSHLFTDFLLQPTSWVRQKQSKKGRSPYLYVHCLLAGLLAYLFAGQWQCIGLIAFIGLTHLLIDYLKLRAGNQKALQYFVADQVAHGLVLLLAWLWLTDNWKDAYTLLKLAVTDLRVVAVLTGYLICTMPIGFVVGLATRKWQQELVAGQQTSDTLLDAGKWIGITERVLLFTFVLLTQYEAIGFLIAAKSLLRFREGEKAPKQSEYVLVGTLLSYALAILTGLAIKLSME